MLTHAEKALVPVSVSKFASRPQQRASPTPVIEPSYPFEKRTDGQGRALVLDPVRRRWVRLTPEEGVRQGLLRHLLALGYPAGLLAVERPFRFLERTWRADVVAYDRHRRPLLLAECKAPGVPLTQAVLDQLARYNVVVRAGLLVLTNGSETEVGMPSNGVVRRIEKLPSFAGLQGGPEAGIAPD
jgi:hypothetical protein